MIGASTIPNALLAVAARDAGEYVFHLDEGVVRISGAELAERANRLARGLAALGVEPGDRVGLLGRNRPEWVVSAFATWFAGGVLVPLQVPLRVRDPVAFREQLEMLVRAGECRHVLADPELAGLLPEDVTVDWSRPGRDGGEAPAQVAPEDAAVVQFTSGSTAVPRGALLTHGAVMAQMGVLDGLVRDRDSGRVSVSWTPFFHDLGLFLNVLPAAVWGLCSHHLPTERFARDPAEWFRLAEAVRASLTLGPSSAFGSALRALLRRREAVDLGALEVVRFAAEGVDPEVLRRIEEAAPRLNLPAQALGSSYGMAEVVLAVTYTAPGSGLRRERVSLSSLASEGLAVPARGGEPARMLVACGRPLIDLRVAGAGGEALPDRHVGEILLRGPSLMSGYIGADPPDPFVDGWLRSGDLGYMSQGQIFVTGRLKDLMIAGGHNYYPEDFEWAAGRVEGVRPGRCVAFGLPDSEEVAILVEARDGARPEEFARRVGSEVARSVGIRPRRVVVLPAGVVRKTTSGKLRRSAMRDLYLNGAIEALPEHADER